MTARFFAVVAASFAAYAVMVLSSLNLRGVDDEGETRRWSRQELGWRAPAKQAASAPAARRVAGEGASPSAARSTSPGGAAAMRAASATPAEAARKVAVGARRDL